MYKFILLQYKMGRVSEAAIRSFVPKWITEQAAEAILAQGDLMG